MRIAVFSDVHSNLPALAAVLQDIRSRGVEQVLCLGDLVGYSPWPNEVIDLLSASSVQIIQGNYDQAVGEELFSCGCDYSDPEAARLGEISLNWTIDAVSEQNKDWLRELPPANRLELAGYRLLAVHGSPRKNTEYIGPDYPLDQLQALLAEADADLLLCGHTHVAYHRQVGDKHVINSGSVGKPKHGNPNAVYQLIELGEQVAVTTVEVPYDFEQVASAILKAGLPEEFARMISTGIA